MCVQAKLSTTGEWWGVGVGVLCDYLLWCSFVNFNDTTSSLWTMVRVLTGEDWHQIMHDCAVS